MGTLEIWYAHLDEARAGAEDPQRHRQGLHHQEGHQGDQGAEKSAEKALAKARTRDSLQAASDIFLGWTKGADVTRHYYWRQLRDMKGSAQVEGMAPLGLTVYAGICGWTLARATPAREIRSRSPPTWARATSSTGRSPTSPSATPSRTSGTIRRSPTRSDPDD
jgi:hypothetical protein